MFQIALSALIKTDTYCKKEMIHSLHIVFPGVAQYDVDLCQWKCHYSGQMTGHLHSFIHTYLPEFHVYNSHDIVCTVRTPKMRGKFLFYFYYFFYLPQRKLFSVLFMNYHFSGSPDQSCSILIHTFSKGYKQVILKYLHVHIFSISNI